MNHWLWFIGGWFAGVISVALFMILATVFLDWREPDHPMERELKTRLERKDKNK